MKQNKPKREKLYIIYDGRALGNTNDAAVMETCDSLEEAEESAPDYGEGCCIWSYDVDGDKLINETFVKSVWTKQSL